MDSPQDNNDFRPISILPVLSKIYERLVHNQVVQFLENHHLLEDNISGFRKGHSTTSVLLSMRDDILKAMNRSECTLLVLADFSKAFDTVKYKSVLEKMKHSTPRVGQNIKNILDIRPSAIQKKSSPLHCIVVLIGDNNQTFSISI